MAHRVLIAALALAAASCSKGPAGPEAPAGAGRLLAKGAAPVVKGSPDGAHVAWLTGCAGVTSGLVALGTKSCELRVAPAGGGEAVVVGAGVSTLPHGFAWAGARTLLALTGYDHATGEGTLVLWDGAAPRKLGERVRHYAATKDGGQIGFVAGGELRLVDGAGARPVEGGTHVATFEFAPSAGAVALLARRESAAGGELLALAGGKLTRVAARTADYRFSPAGDFAFTARDDGGDALAFARAAAPGAAVPLRANVHAFAFAPDGEAVSFIADLAPGRQGDLFLARLPAGAKAGKPERLAAGVGESRWAPQGGALAWLEEFDPGMRSGALVVAVPGRRPERLGGKVSAWEFAPDGRALAYLEHVVEGGYSVDLKLARLGAGDGGAANVETVARGAFGFEFAPEGGWLYYRAACVRNGESCDLLRVPASGLAAGASPEKLAEAVKSFDLDRRRPGRLLLGLARPDGTPQSLAVWRGGQVVAIDSGFVPGTAAFLGPDGDRLAYAVDAKGREGVYVADVP